MRGIPCLSAFVTGYLSGPYTQEAAITLMRGEAEAEKRLAVAEALRKAEAEARKQVAAAEVAARREGAIALRNATDEVMRECTSAAEEEKRKVRREVLACPPPGSAQVTRPMWLCGWFSGQALALWSAQQEAALVEMRAQNDAAMREAVQREKQEAATRLRAALAREKQRAKVRCMLPIPSCAARPRSDSLRCHLCRMNLRSWRLRYAVSGSASWMIRWPPPHRRGNRRCNGCSANS